MSFSKSTVPRCQQDIKSKYEKQEAWLLTELHALRMRLKSAEDHIKEAEDKAELMEKDVKAVRIFMCELQASLTDTKNQNEKLEELIRQEKSMIEQTDCVMCQQCKRSKGWGKLTWSLKGMLQQDKQADQVGKEISAQAGELKKLYLRAEIKVTEVARLKERLKKVQEERTRFQAQGAHIS